MEFCRDFYCYFELGWCEFWMIVWFVEEFCVVGVDEFVVGVDVYDFVDWMVVLSDDWFDEWYEWVFDCGIDLEFFEFFCGGMIGCVVVFDCGEGLMVGFWVDIDGLFIEELDDVGYDFVVEGFCLEMGEMMYVCGYDIYMMWGLVMFEVVKESDFLGCFVVFF